jgi:hypothetical protein
VAAALAIVATAFALLVAPRAPAPQRVVSPPDAANWRVRPFSDDSPWNQVIGTGPLIDPNSAQLLATMNGPLSSDPTQYSFPLYLGDAQTPRHDIACTKYDCTMVADTGTSTAPTLQGVPIPDNATPSTGSDGQMILVDLSSGLEYDLWQAQRTGTGWEVSGASTYSINSDGAPVEYGSRGAGIPYLAGLIRPWEIEQGHIDHAIAFATETVARKRCVWPASKTDGKSRDPDALPQGARLQLDPTLSDADFDRLGLDATARVIARAMQTYGMILVDSSGRTKVYAENLRDNPYASLSWDDDGIKLDDSTVSPIPIDRLRVLALPGGYWTGVGARHGDCFES